MNARFQRVHAGPGHEASRDSCGSDNGSVKAERRSRVQRVLESERESRGAEDRRPSKLQNAKRDIKWLQGVTGEWFEEIQKKKFRNDTDVSSIVKQPLTYRLKNTNKNETTDLNMSRSKSQQTTGSSSSSSSILGLRSPIASLFSFRKLRKQSWKPPSLQRHTFPTLGSQASPRMERHAQSDMYNMPSQNQHFHSPLSTKETRTGVGNAPPAACQLERELFQVLGDLERTLVQEQTESVTAMGTPSYTSRGQYKSGYASERAYSSFLGDQKHCNKSSENLFPDSSVKINPNDSYKTHATFRPQRFYEMYSNRHRTATKHGYFQGQSSNEIPPESPGSMCRSQSSATGVGKFSSSSLNLPFFRHSSSGFFHRGTPKESKRAPLSDIVWSPPLSPCSPVENCNIVSRSHSLMDLTNIDHDQTPKPLQQNSVYEFYRSQHNIPEKTFGKENSFDYVFQVEEKTSRVVSIESESEHCRHVVVDTTQPSDNDMLCQNIVPMQTEDTCDEGNKENCQEADEYDSDATIHSSDTMSESGMDFSESGIDEQQSTPNTLSPAAQLTAQHECVPTADGNLSHQHHYSSSATAEHHLQHRQAWPIESSLHHRYSSPTAAKVPLQKMRLTAASPELPPQQSYLSSEASKLPTQQEKSLSTLSALTHHEYPPSAELKLNPQQGYTSLVTPELPHLHGYSSSEMYVSQTQHDHSFLVSVVTGPPSQNGHSYSGSTSSYCWDYEYSSLPAKLPSDYERSLPAEVPSQFEHSCPTELSSQDGCPPHITHMLLSQRGRSPSTTELPSQHGFSPPVSPTEAIDVKGNIKEPTSQNTVLSILPEDLSGSNFAAIKIPHALSDPAGLIGFKNTESGATHTANCRSPAGSVAHYSAVDDLDCQTDLHTTKMVHKKQMKAYNSDKEHIIPPVTSSHQEDNIYSLFNHEDKIHVEDSNNLKSTTHYDDTSHLTPNILPVGISDQICDSQSPSFCNSTNNVILPRAFKVFDFRASRDQPKYIALHRHSPVLTPTNAFKEESQLSRPHEITDLLQGTKPSGRTHCAVDDSGNNQRKSQTGKHDLLPRQMAHSQRSLDKSDATLHSSLPDISSTYAGLDLAHSEILPTNEDWLTLRSRRTESKSSARQFRRYSSILLQASSLPNLDLMESVLQTSSERLTVKGDNLKTSIADARDIHKHPVQEQSTVRQYRLIGDQTQNKEHSQTQTVPEDTSIMNKEMFESPQALPTTNFELSSDSVTNPKTTFPLKTPTTSLLNCKSPDSLVVNQAANPSTSGSAKDPPFKSNQQLKAPNYDISGTSITNSLNSYTTAIFTTVHYTSFSEAGIGESLPKTALFSVAKPGATTDLSDLTPTPEYQDTRALKASTFVISNLESEVFNVVHEPNFITHQPAASCMSVDAVRFAETHENEQKTENTPCSNWKQTKRQMEEVSLDVLPNNELKPAEGKHFQSTLPSDSSGIMSEPSTYTSNNSVEVPLINDGISDMEKSSLGSFTSQIDNLLSKSACDNSVESENTNMSFSRTSNKPLLPGRRCLGDHLQTYSSSDRTSLFSDHKSRPVVLMQEQLAQTPKPFVFDDDKENIPDTIDLVVPCDVNTCVVPGRTPKKDQFYDPYCITNGSSVRQPPPELPFHLGKVSFFPSSDGAEEQNSLQEYKTKSTISFVSAQDKIEYHELVSVYYTWPRKHSKPLSSALPDVPVSTDKNLLSPKSILNRKQDFHIDLANPALPLPRFLGRRQSTDSLLSNISCEHNTSSIHSTARHSPARSPSWDESEQHRMLSQKGIYSIKNVSPHISLNLRDSPDLVASDVSTHAQYLNSQVASGTADIVDEKKCLSSMPRSHETRGISHQSRLLNSFSPQQLDKGNAFQENFPDTVSPLRQLRNANLENRQAIPRMKEDYNQNILQGNATCGIESKIHNGNNSINTTHGLEYSQIDTDAQVFTCRSQIQDTCPVAKIGALENRVDVCADLKKTKDVMHPASQNILSGDLSLEDLHIKSIKPQFNLRHTTIDRATPLDSHELQKTKQVQISQGNQHGIKDSGFHEYVKNLENNHSLFCEDKLLDITHEQPVTPPATNANRFTFDYTKDSTLDTAKSTNESCSTINWEKMYKVRTRKHSYPHSFQVLPPTSVPLRRGKSDSWVQLNKQKSVSSSRSPLQSLDESGTYDNDWTSLKTANKKNMELDKSCVPLSPVADLTETMLKNTHGQNGGFSRTKRSESDPACSVNYTKSSFMSKGFPDETARTANTYRLSSTLESPGEFDDPSLPVSDWPRNHSRSVQDPVSPLLPFETDNYSSLKSTNFEKSGLTEQNLFEWEMKPWEEDQYVHRSKSLKNLNLQGRHSAFTDIKSRSNGRFSATTNVEQAYGRHPSSPSLSRAFKYNRKFRSHSELMSTDENDNWHSYSHNTPGYRSTRSDSTSPTVGFGIFGKEQQLAFLENIKRSLTEGRLWRPCYLKNPGFLRREADSALETTLFPNSSFGSTIKVPGLPPRETLNIYRDDPVIYSESDTDTTTDDEYYLDEIDKESEL
ncbi:exophilin-5 isoform X2 [Pleurodeles waltl]|uniref:exophilin-5 isoform X2 n=1 Tax=Pleurodeles waltl TaxID=8319 RepID=UPI0037095DB0